MKKFWKPPFQLTEKAKKLILTMKLTVFILFLTLIQVSATVYSQATKFSFKAENKQVVEVLQQIEASSDFRFFFLREQVDVERKVTVTAREATVEQILDELFRGEPVSYEFANEALIVLTRSDNPLGSVNSFLQGNMQQPAVSGTVTDESGQPLPGVTVLIKGTTQGTVTNADGNYSLTNIPEDATLVFSFVGMQTQEIEVGNQTTIDVTMVIDAIGIEEVVAIGYGTIKKSDLTGSVSTVQGDLISNRQTLQLSQGLQGALPGVMVTRDGNRPGSDATIRIRGITTINNSDPLYIIDGIPGTISNINPQDIKSISVLKDGASAAIYGSRAASGVILIETKRAAVGTASLNYEVKYGMEEPTRLPEWVGAVQIMKLYNEGRWNDMGNTGNEYPTFSKELIDNYPALHAEDPYAYPDYDWQGNGLDKFAPTQSHHLSFTVGTERLQTKASVSYIKSDYLYNGLSEEDASFQRITARVNNDLTVNKFISGAIDFNVSRGIDKRGPVTRTGRTADNYVIPFHPLYTPFWEDGRPTPTRGAWNEHAVIKYGGSYNVWRNRVGGKISLHLTPLEGLEISAILAPNYVEDQTKNWKKAVPNYQRDNPNNIAGYVFQRNSTDLTESRPKSYDVTSQFLLNYAKSMQHHSLNLMVGYENFYRFSESLEASSAQFELSQFPYLDMGNENYLANSGNASELAYRSYFGRLVYNYNNKYLLQGNVRYDGSSRFHRDHRWGLFPSISVGWVITEEQFMDNIANLSFLKIRGSWGVLGNDRIGTYPYQSTIDFDTNLIYRGDEITSVLNSRVQRFAIEDISWETTETVDIGVDAYLFDNKLRFTGDYYIKTTRDMLLALEIPNYMGVSNPDQNTGSMETKGWEIDLGYSNNIGQFNYTVSANLSDFKSVMGDLGGTEFLGNQIKIEGSEFNEWYGFRSDGLFQTEEELDNSPVLDPTVRTGDIKLLDVSGPEGVPDGKISPDHDRVLLGGSLPRYQYGGNLEMKYKNIDFSLIFQGVGKQNVRIDANMIKHHGENEQEISRHYAENYWSVYNTDEENLKALYPRFTGGSAYNQIFTFSDFWLFNGAYFRLKNIMLGYTIPTQLTQRYQMRNVRVYGSISNLFSIDNYYPGWDPELTSGSYWMTRTFLVGLSVTF
jgi:TonB-linked SusC/RagA family outer membrane protein